MGSFELFVAGRYLRAKRKERFISIVTVISIVGVAIGVAALVVAMAINNGVQQDLRAHLLSATAHVNLLEKELGFGIEDWRTLIEDLSKVEHVTAAAPALYGEMMISTQMRARGCFLKGVIPSEELKVAGLLTHISEGSLDDLEKIESLREQARDDPDVDPPYSGVVIGSRLARTIGARVSTVVSVLNPQGEMTPFGRIPGVKRFQVVAIFDSGFFDYDNMWAFTTLKSAQQALSLGDVINDVEFRIDDLDRAEEVARAIEQRAGEDYGAVSWMERNRTVFNALEMEKLVTAIAIGLIMLVAALNILISLVMMVMEKGRDIAILKSMGARAAQIRRIFMWQGLIIGAIGVTLGLALGHLVCFIGDRYKLIPLEAEIYGISYVPFAPRLGDGIAVAAAALLICYLISIYPSSTASRIAPAETLRYE